MSTLFLDVLTKETFVTFQIENNRTPQETLG